MYVMYVVHNMCTVVLVLYMLVQDIHTCTHTGELHMYVYRLLYIICVHIHVNKYIYM